MLETRSQSFIEKTAAVMAPLRQHGGAQFQVNQTVSPGSITVRIVALDDHERKGR